MAGQHYSPEVDLFIDDLSKSVLMHVCSQARLTVLAVHVCKLRCVFYTEFFSTEISIERRINKNTF